MSRESIIANPGKFKSGITATAEYRREMQKELEPRKGIRRAVKFGALACEAAARTSQGYETKESAVYRLISHIDSFSDSQEKLDHFRNLERQGVYIHFTQKEPHLREVIGFNHAVKELVDLDQNIRFNELVTFIAGTYEGQHVFELNRLDAKAKQDKLAWLRTSVQVALNGMRHELAYEQILGELQARGIDLEYDSTTEDDELHGTDYFVTLDGIRRKIDVKASPHGLKMPHHVWSQVRYGRQSDGKMIDEFNNGFRITPELVAQKADAVLADLQYIAKIA